MGYFLLSSHSTESQGCLARPRLRAGAGVQPLTCLAGVRKVMVSVPRDHSQRAACVPCDHSDTEPSDLMLLLLVSSSSSSFSLSLRQASRSSCLLLSSSLTRISSRRFLSANSMLEFGLGSFSAPLPPPPELASSLAQAPQGVSRP